MDVVAWLRGLGLERYAPAFCENDVDDEVLPELTSEDLISIGVTSVGHRRRLLAAIASLGDEVPAVLTAISCDATAHADAERRQLTVMFCDLVGSTALSSRLDPEDLSGVIAAYNKTASEVIRAHDGFVAEYMGDGVLAYFGYPCAHEDDAESAVQAGLELVDAIPRIEAHVAAQLHCRVGIATGLVVVDLLGSGEAQKLGALGDTPNLAARLQGLAKPNMVIIDPTTRRLVGALYEYRDLGAVEVKGLVQSAPAWQVLGPSIVASRFEALRGSTLSPLIGRDEEMDLLLRRWSKAKTGEGHVVLLSGEAGIGKSRLTAALLERLTTETHTRLRYFCSPHRADSAFHPIIGQMERAAGLACHDKPQAKLDKLDSVLVQTSTSPEDAALFAEILSLPNDRHPFIGQMELAAGFARDDTIASKLDKLEALLCDGAEPGDISLIAEMLSLSGGERFPPLDLSPQRKKERTFAALLRQIQALARRQPILMIFEDLHWIDPTSREVLDLTVERITGLPVLLVATYRPEFQPPWVGGSQVTVIALNRLGRNEATSLVHRLTGNLGALPPDIVDEIVERTDGVPLFVEEMTKAVVEAGADCGYVSISAVPPSSLAVPATLHASLLGRLERLGPAAKNVAQAGAAIGHDFSHELLAAAVQLAEPELQEAVHRLVEAGLVFQRGLPPAAEYLFKHALVQDTAYSTLLRGPRQALHRRIAEALEQRFPDLVQTRPEILADHYGEAAIADKAIGYWHCAGKLSVAKSAVREATAQLRRGLSLLEGLPKTRERQQLELDIHVTLIAALMAGKGYADPEVFAALERANRLVTETAAVGTPLHFSVLFGLWASSSNSGAIAAALGHATNFLSSAQSQPSSGPLLVGHRILAYSLMRSGDYRAALAHVETAASLYRPDEHRDDVFRYGQDIGVSAFVMLSWALWHRGYPDQSARAADRALALSRQLGHAHTLANAFFHAGVAAVFARDVTTVCANGNDCVTLANEHGFAYWSARGRILQGWAVAHRGEAMTGIARIRDGLVATEATGTRVPTPFYLTLQAEALALAGKIEEGLAALDDALAKAAASGETGWDAEIHRLRGELNGRLPHPDPAKVEESFRAALAIAREQGARGYELRAATSLARLWREQGRQGEARDLLAPLYGSFTEGFDTADLKEAKRLLEELA